jgi:hypothetical protein
VALCVVACGVRHACMHVLLFSCHDTGESEHVQACLRYSRALTAGLWQPPSSQQSLH